MAASDSEIELDFHIAGPWSLGLPVTGSVTAKGVGVLVIEVRGCDDDDRVPYAIDDMHGAACPTSELADEDIESALLRLTDEAAARSTEGSRHRGRAWRYFAGSRCTRKVASRPAAGGSRLARIAIV